MAEQQLVDYIKKARESGQTDDQTRNLLYKNGWTEAEVNDAFSSLSQPQMKPQPQAQPQVADQPQPEMQAQPQIQQQPAQSSMPQFRAKSHLALKLLMVLIILVVLCGAGFFVAGQFINLPWNPFRPSPETVLSKMLANIKNVKSSHTVMHIEVGATDQNKVSEGKLILDSNTETDITDINNPKADGNISVNLTPSGAASSAISASVDIKVVGNALYFKFNSITVPSSFSYPGFDISQINGKWLEFNQDSIKALSNASLGRAAMPGISQVNNPELTKKIQDLISSENLLSVGKQLNDEVISGQNTYHYLLVINKAKIEDLFSKIVMLEIQQSLNLQTQNGQTIDANSALVQNMAQAAVKTFVDAIGDVNMEVWIGKNDSMLYQVKLDKTIDASKIPEALGITMANTNLLLEVKFDVTNSNFNKPIIVQAPEGAQKVEDVISLGSKASQVELDMNKLGFTAQSIFNTYKSYSLLCKNGFLNGSRKTSYGLQFISVANDLIKQGAKNPICFANLQDYCVSTQLSNGAYMCIDKNGSLGKTKCTSYNTVCK